MSILLDTNILISALGYEGIESQLLNLLLEKNIPIVVSDLSSHNLGT